MISYMVKQTINSTKNHTGKFRTSGVVFKLQFIHLVLAVTNTGIASNK
jgi:hypothetical protein